MSDRRVQVGLVCAMLAWPGAASASPEDEAVTSFLREEGLRELLEVQLFDRISAEEDEPERRILGERLGSLYLSLIREGSIDEATRERAMARARVLCGMMPEDAMLDLRLELIAQVYRAHERSAALARIDLLGDGARESSIAALTSIGPELDRIAQYALVSIDRLDKAASRSVGDRQAAFDQELGDVRATHSRARFIQGWVGYALGVLERRVIAEPTLLSFGWILGFEGKTLVLDRVDTDLLEYEHVARSMLGVAMCRSHNAEIRSGGDFTEARLWLTKLTEARGTPDDVRALGQQRLLGVIARERDWREATRQAYLLRDTEPDTLLTTPVARDLAIQGLTAMGARDPGLGGVEGAQECARIALEQLVSLGEIGHVLELSRRFGSLPMLRSGFIAAYTRALDALSRADAERSANAYAVAADELRRAIESDDADEYRAYVRECALSLAYCEIRAERPERAIETIAGIMPELVDPAQIEQARWLDILAHDGAISGGATGLGQALRTKLGSYLRDYANTDRANTLVVRFALGEHLDPRDAVEALLIDNPDDPLAITARRKLVQLLYEHPELGGLDDAERFGAILMHAQWIWAHEPEGAETVREARERLAVSRIVLETGMRAGEGADPEALMEIVERAESIIAAHPALVGSSGEITYRRVQVLLRLGEVDEAGTIVLDPGSMETRLLDAARVLVFVELADRFDGSGRVDDAQRVVRVGDRIREGIGQGPLSDRDSSILATIARAYRVIGEETGSDEALAIAEGLARRVVEFGVADVSTTIMAAQLAERRGDSAFALECWSTLVGSLRSDDERWWMARYESLRLLRELDPDGFDAAMAQYRALYPEGAIEPWGERIEALDQGGGGAP
jgi:tetratricopeptide (TPR) repeat protein